MIRWINAKTKPKKGRVKLLNVWIENRNGFGCNCLTMGYWDKKNQLWFDNLCDPLEETDGFDKVMVTHWTEPPYPRTMLKKEISNRLKP